MPLTVQKLQARLRDLRQATEVRAHAVTPLACMPADGPMSPPPSPDDGGWQPLEVGQPWGLTHSTCWLQAELAPHHYLPDQTPLLQLCWDQREEDSLLRRLEATVFLDGQVIGALDWAHPQLALSAGSMAADLWQRPRPHRLTLQVYTRAPRPFDGLFLLTRYDQVYRLYETMQTLLDVALTLHDDEPVRHHLLAAVNAAYIQLDVRTGWQSEELHHCVPQVLTTLRQRIDELPDGGARPCITVSGHAHLDVAWLWPYWRTRQKIAHTIANVLALMERYPDYRYSQSQPQLLQWLKEDLPEVYARVKERVEEGRFEPVGAMWVESDCNLPSGESLVRQVMHGTRFMREEFGITPRVIWLPDVFGYSAALPQIMRGCAIPCFMTIKISWNQFNRLPVDTFRWRGIDGSEVLAHFITAPGENASRPAYTYNGPLQPSDISGTWRIYQQQALNNELLYLGGWGDGGGGPTEEQLERAQIMADLPAFPQVHMGRVETYFAELYQRLWEHPHLPTWVGELYLEYHRGTYTSQARNKAANRRMELLYRDAELLNAWASLYGAPLQQEKLNTGWQLILLNQFHDVLPGSSIHEVYTETARIYAEVAALAEPVRDEMLAVLGSKLGTTRAGHRALMLTNTLSWERLEPLQIPGAYGELLPTAQLARDWDGQPLTLLDGLTLPACGALLTASFPQQQPDIPPAALVIRDDGCITLHNALYTLDFNAEGEIARLYHREADREVLVPGQTANQLIVYEDRPLNYDAWDIDLYYEEKPYPLRDQVEIRPLEYGPVRATVEVTRTFLSSRITQRISLWRTSPRIDFVTEIDWHDHQLLLKAAFPVAINATRATYEIQFGSLERATHRNTSWEQARFEVCAHRWVDLSDGGYGVSLLNESKYGHDIHDQVIRLTLLKSATSPDPEADQGLHRLTYSLLPHQGDWRTAQTVRRAYELNVPVLVRPGFLPAEHSDALSRSLLWTDCPHIVIDTVKPAEDGQGLIVRLYEAHNQQGKGSLTFASALRTAQECNLLEEPLGAVHFQEKTLFFQVRPYEIKSFRVDLARLG